MADRPQVPGWKNDKPNEYSSEFTVDGNVYANVTNVTTGQRQLYLVRGLAGTIFTQRTLITTVNADGNVTKGEGYDDFIRAYSAGKLQNAEINNKKQSSFIISKASTPEELAKLRTTPQYKSSLGAVAGNGGSGGGNNDGGNNEGNGNNNAANESPVPIESLTTSVDRLNARIRTDYGDYFYPKPFPEKQDCIKFTMSTYKPKKFNSMVITDDKETNANIIGEPFVEDTSNKDKEKVIKGSVTLPIQSPISDSNTVSWGGQTMTTAEANAASAALTLIAGSDINVQASAKNAGQAAESLIPAITLSFAEKAATGSSGQLFTRITGAIFNPNMELLFNGPELRSFSFTFKMSARRDEEAREIRNIIRFFKQGMSVKRGKTNLFLISPNIFEIQYLYRGGGNPVDHPWINKIKKCALQNCSVNYTPEGNYATYDDGAMTSYEITLQFGELTPIYDDDYGNSDGFIGY